MVKAKKIVRKKTVKKEEITVVDNDAVFRQICHEYKTLHAGSMIDVLLLDDRIVSRAVAAWPNVTRIIEEAADDIKSPWEMIWYNPEDWMTASSVPKRDWARVMKTVIDNNLVYADGTLPDSSRAYLLTKAREIMGLPRETPNT